MGVEGAPSLATAEKGEQLIQAAVQQITDFAALPGAPTPDRIIPAGSFPFFSTLGADTVTYSGQPGTPWAAGQLPLDGTHSWTKPNGGGAAASALATPTNFAGDTSAAPASTVFSVA